MIKSKSEKLIVEISTPDEIFNYNINQDRKISVKGISGQTEIEIQNNKIWVSDSPCGNKTCIHQGKISRNGQWLCCAPNQIMIVIKNDGDDSSKSDVPDAVSF